MGRTSRVAVTRLACCTVTSIVAVAVALAGAAGYDALYEPVAAATTTPRRTSPPTTIVADTSWGYPRRVNAGMEGHPAMVTETISVPEIHCDHCRVSIEGALAPITGVQRAAVDIPARAVTVTYDEASVGRDRLIEAIEQQGYEVPAQ